MQKTDPQTAGHTGRRLRFSVWGLLTFTLIIALVLGFFYQRRRVQEAEQILASHGLAWDRPITADEVRVNAHHDYSNREWRQRILIVRLQSASHCTFKRTGGGETRFISLMPTSNGMFTGEFVLWSEDIFTDRPGGNHLVRNEFSQISGLQSIRNIRTEKDPTSKFWTRLQVVVKPGIYKRNSRVPLFSTDGVLTELIIQ